MELHTKELIERVGLSEEQRDAMDSDSGVKCIEYHVLEKGIVVVESTASELMDSLIDMPIELQKKLVGVLLDALPELGDELILVGGGFDDNDSGGRKRRRSRLVRVKPTEGAARILMTR